MPGYHEKEWKEYTESIKQVGAELDRKERLHVFYRALLFGAATLLTMAIWWVVKQ